MLAYLKTWMFRGLTVAVVVLFFVAAFLYFALEDKQRSLDAANEIIKAQTLVLRIQDRVISFDREITNATNEVIETIEEAPNAETLVPPDVASAWHDAIVRLRDNDKSRAIERNAKLPAIDAGNTASRKLDSRGPSELFSATGRSPAKV